MQKRGNIRYMTSRENPRIISKSKRCITVATQPHENIYIPEQGGGERESRTRLGQGGDKRANNVDKQDRQTWTRRGQSPHQWTKRRRQGPQRGHGYHHQRHRIKGHQGHQGDKSGQNDTRVTREGHRVPRARHEDSRRTTRG